MSETKETVVHTLGTEWRGEKTWRATCSCGWRGANSKSGGADQDKARHRRDAEVFADTYGVILQRGDEVKPGDTICYPVRVRHDRVYEWSCPTEVHNVTAYGDGRVWFTGGYRHESLPARIAGRGVLRED